MKKLAIIFIVITISSLVQSQQTPEGFISRIPNLPENTCTIDNGEREDFLSKLYKLEADLQAEIVPRKKIVEDAYNNSKINVEKNIGREYGLSDTDIQRLKNKKKMTDAEKKTMVDKMLQEKSNLSLKEIENLKKTSKEGKEAWAEAYTTEQMATMEGKQDSVNAVNEKNMNRYELAKEQSELTQQIAANDKKLVNQLNYLEENDSSKILLEKRDSLMANLGKCSAEEYNRIVREIQQLEKIYCNLMTPQYFDILKERSISMLSFMSIYSKLEKVNAELNEATLNVKNKDFYSPGLMGLEAVHNYVTLLMTAFKYANYTFPEGKN